MKEVIERSAPSAGQLAQSVPRARLAARGVKTLLIALTVGAAAVFLLASPRRVTVAYCADCVRQQDTREWGFPGFSRTLFRQQKEVASPMHKLLTDKKLVPPHVHRWVEPRTVRDPVHLYGPPVTQSLAYINTPMVVALMRNLTDYADPVSIDNARRLILRPEYSYLINHSLRFQRFPPQGFRERRQFLAWWTENAFPFYAHLREETEPD